MRYSWSIFLLLTIAEKPFVAESNMIHDFINRLFGARNGTCVNNSYNNDPALFTNLNGYLYNLYSSVGLADNEVVKFDSQGNGTIFARTTKNDGECCRTLHFQSGQEYIPFDIENDANCSTELVDDSGRLKLLVSNEVDDSCCTIFWTCRKSRRGVHAFCDNRNISQEQSEWIYDKFDEMGLTALEVDQTTDLHEGKCFEQ